MDAGCGSPTERNFQRHMVGAASYSTIFPCARFARWLVWRCAIWPQFEAMYAKVGRPLIPSTKPLRALLPRLLYTVRSERMLMEQWN